MSALKYIKAGGPRAAEWTGTKRVLDWLLLATFIAMFDFGAQVSFCACCFVRLYLFDVSIITLSQSFVFVIIALTMFFESLKVKIEQPLIIKSLFWYYIVLFFSRPSRMLVQWTF